MRNGRKMVKRTTFQPSIETRAGIPSSFVSLALAAVFVFASAAGLQAEDFPEPEWSEDAMVLSHQFPTDDPNPFPDQFSHPDGAAAMQSAVFVGELGIGWENPDDYPGATVREDSGGAWDLGKGEPDSDGRIEISFGLSNIMDPGSFPGYEVELFVNVVRYSSLGGIPTFSVEGYNTTDTSVEDGFYDMRTSEEGFNDFWNLTTWSGRVVGLMEEEMTFVLNAHPTQGTVVDTVEVWANWTEVPEPRTYALLFGLAAIAFTIWRRRSAR